MIYRFITGMKDILESYVCDIDPRQQFLCRFFPGFAMIFLKTAHCRILSQFVPFFV